MAASSGDASLEKKELQAVAMVTISSLYLLACGVFTVVARTYLYNYYTGAHVALIGIIISLFVISHHVFKVRRLLQHTERTFIIVQVTLNLWCAACSMVTALGYSTLAGMSIHTNYDYVSALTLAWLNLAFCLYLSVLLVIKLHHWKTAEEHQSNTQGGSLRRTDTQMSTFHGAATTNTHNDSGSTDNDMSDRVSEDSALRLVSDQPPPPIKRCCVYTIRALYYTTQVALALLFVLTSYHACCVIDDTLRYREDANMVTVSVPGHRPIALFVKCAGSGNETIVMENGLGGMVYMGWSFIPANLSHTYTVCAYDRRGYGWSEGYEHDYPISAEPQWAGSNIDFLEKLIVSAKIPTPFFYVGHSYGGYHMTLLSLRRPEVIKGLVFLDSARFSPLSTLRSLMGIVANALPTGLLRLSIDLKILNYRSIFGSVVDFDSLSSEEEERLMSIFRSGNFFSTYQREAGPLVSSRYAYNGLIDELGNRTIDKPVLVIDAGDRINAGEWLSQTNFIRYNSGFYKTVNGTDHQTLIYSREYSWKTKDLIDEFIQSVSSSQ